MKDGCDLTGHNTGGQLICSLRGGDHIMSYSFSLRWITILCVTACCLPLFAATSPNPSDRPDPVVVTDWVQNELSQNATAEVIVRFDRSEDWRASAKRWAPYGRDAVVQNLRARALTKQQAAREWLDANDIKYRSLWIVNALAIEVNAATLTSIKTLPNVVRIEGDPKVYGIQATRDEFPQSSLPSSDFAQHEPTTNNDEPTPDATEWGIRAIQADRVWAEENLIGRGFVVASADTGVEWDHPAIRDQYRGWDAATQTASHDYNWYDPIENRAVPIDDHDHGTHTTGTMVGDDGNGNQIGVAPGAKWVGCRNMDHGNGQPSTYLDCMQYFIAPWPHGGNPDTDGDPSMAPHVINNSWGCPSSEGCQWDTLQDGVASVVAAGIVFVASAGNSGPFCSTVSAPPAIYEDSFTVGSTDSSGSLSIFSSKGPVTVDGSSRLKPDVSAPGGSVRSAVRGGGYASFSGTSMAGPHVAGAFALLWESNPALYNNRELSQCVMSRSGTPVSVSFFGSCGGTSHTSFPNNISGWGEIDIYRALNPSGDSDSDGITSDCDCDPSNGGVFAAPADADSLGVAADKVTITWDDQFGSAGSATVHDLMRGNLDLLRNSGSTSDASCLASGIAAGQHVDNDQPVSGAGMYYLIRARNSCGSASFGEDSSDAPRDVSSCP